LFSWSGFLRVTESDRQLRPFSPWEPFREDNTREVLAER
jgi:hypothetical protein